MMHPMRRVAIVVFDGLQSLDATGPLEVFATAARVDPGAGYEVELVARSADAVTTSSGLRLLPHRAFAGCRGPLDTLIVAGGDGSRAAANDAATTRFVASAAGRARRTASVCTGAFVLAAAGLLDGRRATTHWAACDELTRFRPQIDVDPDPIFIRDGDITTSAGVTAGMDLALALVEEDCGRSVALTVARYLVLFVQRPGGQAQFSSHLSAQLAEREPLRELQAWMLDHLDADLSVAALAERAHMSPRNFARAFAREVGMTPAAFVEAVRVERARARLESGDAPLATIARACGFGTAETMRRAFHRRVGVAPADYRSRFRTTGGPHADRHPDLRPVHGAGRRRAL
jgi:transcriptional regulator GlxA family with amidase domain